MEKQAATENDYKENIKNLYYYVFRYNYLTLIYPLCFFLLEKGSVVKILFLVLISLSLLYIFLFYISISILNKRREKNENIFRRLNIAKIYLGKIIEFYALYCLFRFDVSSRLALFLKMILCFHFIIYKLSLFYLL